MHQFLEAPDWLATKPQSLGASASWLGPQVGSPSSQRTPTKRIISACAVTRPEPIDASLLGMAVGPGPEVASHSVALLDVSDSRTAEDCPAESRVNTTRPLARDPKSTPRRVCRSTSVMSSKDPERRQVRANGFASAADAKPQQATSLRRKPLTEKRSRVKRMVRGRKFQTDLGKKL